jgi:predicted alpha/beta-fold hydrolase
MRGHLWTIAPVVRHELRRRVSPRDHAADVSRGAPWETHLVDAVRGRVRLSGRWQSSGDEGAPAVVLVHGLGGSIESHYVLGLARALERARFDVLRLHLRGADRRGDDYYHAGLTADLDAALSSVELASREQVAIVGFSLGGHLALRYASEEPSARVQAIAAIGPPLDLALGSQAIDRRRRAPYLRHVLGGMVEIYEAVAARHDVPIAVAEARRIRSLREWDERIIAPRFGFRDADDYYARVSVGPRLGAIEVPTLLVVGAQDPMIPLEVVRPSLARASKAVDVRIVDGGHVGFPRTLDLGRKAPLGLEEQLVRWLLDTLALKECER